MTNGLGLQLKVTKKEATQPSTQQAISSMMIITTMDKYLFKQVRKLTHSSH